ncbi:HS12A-like protein [Mya arenaria]|uniref:HS12A-like protein n=1 Tax=Mya arenaria TaxID=6604 RepID=A0ABY7DR21_MYAAR|nr:HS12A-like protein [Mya arenaria]
MRSYRYDLSRHTELTDDKGKRMPAMKVFAEGIRYLKEHLLTACGERTHGLDEREMHWAGIATDQLSLALEPEAASLFCKYLPVEKIEGATGKGISAFAPGRKYLVLDAGDMDQKVTFKMPISIHETFSSVRGEDFRRSLIMKHDLKDQVTFAGDKLRIQAAQVKNFFTETCDTIIGHLRNVLGQPTVRGTDTILMVGGFSESPMLQRAVKEAFSEMKIIIPAEAGLAVLKGAVIFGHNPTAIASRVSRFTYGISVNKTFIPGVHPESKKVINDGRADCQDCFDKHVQIDQEVEVGQSFDEKGYIPSRRNQRTVAVRVFTSTERNPKYVDDPGCTELGNINVDMSNIDSYEERNFVVKMIYGDTELHVEAKVLKTGEVLNASFDFLA